MTPPSSDGLTDQVAQVGSELDVVLHGTDKAGLHLSYSFQAADVTDLANAAEMTQAPDGSGIFKWTPLAADIGTHAFDFTVSNGNQSTTVTIAIDVKSAIGAATAPIFRQPLGTGTTIDLTTQQCVDVDVVVEDDDTPAVTIAQEAPVIDGAQLMSTGGQTATWHWCPTMAQASETRYTLILSADDGNNPKTMKDYLIVLRSGDGASCPGAPPAIDSSPSDQTTVLDLPITATVTDDVGIKDAPLLYYSPTDPGASPDLSTMIQLTMTQQSGDATSGVWTATVPNPVATAPAGTTAQIFYAVVADDSDDPNGSCNHATTSQVYSLTVTAGGDTTAGLCAPCTADSQCGDGNECVFIGDLGDSYCLQACDAGCATGYACSADTIFSVDGAEATQCVPQNGSCTDITAACVDDSYEPNDSRSQASANGPIDPGFYDLVSCPATTNQTSANNDYFKIVVDTDSQIDITLSGDGTTDLDLHLYTSDGTTVAASIGPTADEEIAICVPAATYYIKVNGYGQARSEYFLDYEITDPDAVCQ